ncbi:MAG: leucine-rich repeat domain-containing protein, partial [Bacteroidaceae bacterium]|nr:leucine-rich repeat domain-containing protein [Bacteroidaceae bacterium]
MNYFQINGIYYNLNECKKTAQVTEGPDEYSGAVSIPETVSYNGKTYTVTSIGNEAFCGCSGLTSVNIGNSVTCIGNEAFWGCSELTSVNIPGSITNIGDWAFGFCSGLTSVNIPCSVTNIGDSAFAFCSVLTSIYIPNSVTSIGEGAFSDCSGLTSINVETGNTIYDSRNNCNAIIETATNTLITGCKN